MSSRTVIPISAHPQVGKISEADYFRLYQQSIDDPDGFWGEHGKRLDWIKPFTKVKNASFDGRRADRLVSRTEPSTPAATASTGILPGAASRPRSCGRATIPARTAASPIANCTRRSAGSPMC